MRKATKYLYAAGAACAAAVVAVKTAAYLADENKDIVITEYDFGSKSVPEGFEGFRIANVSDLQSEYFGKDQSQLLSKVAAAQPDIIVMTGDLVDRNHTDIMAAIRAVKGLLKIAPVYYVNGNHEVRLPESKMRPFYAELRQMGVKVLLDQNAMVVRKGAHINLVGLSEYSVFKAKAVGVEEGEGAESEVLMDHLEKICNRDDDGFTVLLAHEPQYLAEYATSRVDLILCGHAHGGQFRTSTGQGWFAPNQGALPKYTSGFYRWGASTMLLSRGLGNSVFPQRINNKPEVTVVTLHAMEDPMEEAMGASAQ